MAATFAFVDNNPETIQDELKAALGKENVSVIRYPDDFNGDLAKQTKKHLEAARVVLMDLDLYEGQEEPAFSLAPRSGIALEKIIREWLTEAGHPFNSAKTAFVLFSHKLDSLGVTVEGREHIVARRSGNEWVTSKNAKERPAAHQRLDFLLGLSDAVGRLPIKWPEDPSQAKSSAFALLGLENVEGDDWRSVASADAEKSAFPLQSILVGDGMALIRWLLHVGLPFPGALIDRDEIAVLLRLSPATFDTKPAVLTNLQKEIAECEYSGLLSGFQGKRWWRAGVNEFVRQLASAAGGTREKLWEALAKKIGVNIGDLTPTTLGEPVIVVDDQFRKTHNVSDMKDCVRVVTDDWPPEIDAPWMPIKLATSTSRLKTLIHPDDQYRTE